MISRPSERGRTYLLKNLFLMKLDIDNLFIIGSTGDQYEDCIYAYFIPDINELA